jgi:predicted NACHT family NTPase
MYSTGDPEADKALVQVATAAAKEAFKGLWDGATAAPEWIRRKYGESDPFGSLAQRYCGRIEQRHNQMKVIGMSRPVPIRAIFVRVNVLEKVPARHRSPIEELERNYEVEAGFGRATTTVDGLKVVNTDARLAVLGRPGGGKTTFLKWIALSAIDGKLKQKQVPVLIPLKSWSDGKDTIREAINAEFKVCGFEEPNAFVDRLLDKGALILLLDALDEIDDKKRFDAAVKEIRDLSDKYPKIRVVISCRSAAYTYLFEQFTDVELADFQWHQMEQFIKRWFIDSPHKRELCIAELKREKNRSIRELCRTPLLLTLMCLVFDDGMAFPNNRAELYREAVDVLLKRWDTSRSIRRNTAYEQLSLKKKELLLGRIAQKYFEQGKIFFRQEEVERMISEFMHSLKPNTDGTQSDVDAGEVLREIEAQHGLLVERATRIYSFSHLTFQEYFTARMITDTPDNKSAMEALIAKRALDPRWREVFILATGLLSQADDFVSRLRLRATALASAHLAIRDVLHRTSALVHTTADVPLPLRRALALSYVAENITERWMTFRAVAEACSELVEDMQNEFGRLKQVDIATVKTLRLGLVAGRQKVDELIDHVFLTHVGALDALAQYVQLTRLLVNCLNVEAVIDYKVREQLVSHILIEK